MRRLVWHGRAGFGAGETAAGRHQPEWGSRKRRRLGAFVDGSESTHAAATSGALESVARQQHTHPLRRSGIESAARVDLLQVMSSGHTPPPDSRSLMILFDSTPFLQRRRTAVEFEAPPAEWRPHLARGHTGRCRHVLVLRHEFDNGRRSENAAEIRNQRDRNARPAVVLGGAAIARVHPTGRHGHSRVSGHRCADAEGRMEPTRGAHLEQSHLAAQLWTANIGRTQRGPWHVRVPPGQWHRARAGAHDPTRSAGSADHFARSDRHTDRRRRKS